MNLRFLENLAPSKIQFDYTIYYKDCMSGLLEPSAEGKS